MATFDAVKSGTSANSYATVDDADDYFELDYTAGEWFNLDDGTKEKLLVAATRQIDQLNPKYSTVGVDQALNFPMATTDLTLGDGFEQARQACMLQALYIFQNQDAMDEARAGMLQGMKSEKIGPVGKTMTGFNPLGQWAPGVLRMLANFIEFEMSVSRA